MIRLLLAGVFMLVAASVSAQTPVAVFPLQLLEKGRVTGLVPIELDGLPGSEYLVRFDADGLFSNLWHVYYPQQGMCDAGTVTYWPWWDQMPFDFNGDGIQELARFDVETQTLTFLKFPRCGE
jgi:hypothetical protein